MTDAELLAELTEDPVFNVLFAGIKGFWQGYYSTHAALLRHLAVERLDLSEEDRTGLVSRAVQAAVLAARQTPPTVTELHNTLYDICLPILREMGLNEADLEDLKDEDEIAGS